MALSQSTFSDLGGAVSDIFGAGLGGEASAQAYTTAAKIAEENTALTLRSTAVQEAQAQHKEFQTIGGEQAETAGAGFTAGGSSLALLRSSAQQAALQNQLVENQGQITAQGFAQQAAAYQGQAGAAQKQSSGGFLGGLLSIGGAIASLF